MKVDKIGKRWAAIASLIFSHFFAIGLGEIWMETGAMEVAPPWWTMCIIGILGTFFGGIYFFSEDE